MGTATGSEGTRYEKAGGDAPGEKVAAVVLAAGKGTRMAAGERKQFRSLAGKPVFRWSVDAFGAAECVDEIVVVTGHDRVEDVRRELTGAPKVKVVTPGGKSRRESVYRGLSELSRDVGWVLVHDGVRPLVRQALIEDVLRAAKEVGAATPGVQVSDTVKRVDSMMNVERTVDRTALWAVQTPQAFRRDLLERAHARATDDATDDCGLVESLGSPVRIVPGDSHNLKITTERDWEAVCALIGQRTQVRVGFGFDVHRLVEGRPLVLGGAPVAYAKGLAGHSDADVLTHAVIDGLFGAAGMDDIGAHFPDTDERYRGADSLGLLRAAAEEVRAANFRVSYVDAFISAERPKLRPFIQTMRANLAGALGVDEGRVNVKAGTGEGAGPVGRGEVIEARAVVTLEWRPAGE